MPAIMPVDAAAASDEFVLEAFERTLARISANGVAGSEVRERKHLDPTVKQVLDEDFETKAFSKTYKTQHFSGLGAVDVVITEPPIFIELKWSYDEKRSKIFESVWDAIKLSLLAVYTGSLAYIATGASTAAWKTCESADLFEEGHIDPQEIWKRALVPSGPNSGATIGEDLIFGSRSRGRPHTSAAFLAIAPIARLPYPDDYELRIARIEGSGPMTRWPEHLPGTEVP